MAFKASNAGSGWSLEFFVGVLLCDDINKSHKINDYTIMKKLMCSCVLITTNSMLEKGRSFTTRYNKHTKDINLPYIKSNFMEHDWGLSPGKYFFLARSQRNMKINKWNWLVLGALRGMNKIYIYIHIVKENPPSRLFVRDKLKTTERIFMRFQPIDRVIQVYDLSRSSVNWLEYNDN